MDEESRTRIFPNLNAGLLANLRREKIQAELFLNENISVEISCSWNLKISTDQIVENHKFMSVAVC